MLMDLANMYKLEFYPLINDYFSEAATYSASISLTALNRFKFSLKNGYINILAKPENYFVLQTKNKIRRYHLDDFAYSIIYAMRANNLIYVLAIKHDKQRNYWNKRLNPIN